MYLPFKDGHLVRVNSASVNNRLLLRNLLVDVHQCVMDWGEDYGSDVFRTRSSC